MNHIPFYVINESFVTKGFKPYDIMPYFIEEYNTEDNKPITFEQFKDFIRHKSLYQFWGKCEYEFLIGSWPYGSYKMKNKLKEFLTPEFDIEDSKQNIDFLNIITEDMEKVDIHQQIMMNLDIITKVLMDNVIK